MVKDRFRLSGTFVACRVPQAHGSLSGRWDAMSSQRAVASAWSAEETESGGSASACASACRGTGQRTLVPATRRRMPDGAGRAAQ